jgi:succinate dehydrogenase / fumarate reductase cytochrome b subunit
MNWLNSLLASNIGRKLVMALTGLFLVSFLFVHLSGNLLLLVPDDGFAFNQFCHFMGTNSIIRIMEVVLFGGFLIHIYTAYFLVAKNNTRRPTPYAAGNKTPGVSWFSKNMALTGTLILIFLVLHIKTFWYQFKFGEVPKVFYTEIASAGEHNDVVRNDIEVEEEAPPGVQILTNYTVVAEDAFAQPLYVVFYLVAFGFLGLHLLHGFSSAFLTLGLDHKKYFPLIKGLGWVIGIGVPLGFAAIPILMMFA